MFNRDLFFENEKITKLFIESLPQSTVSEWANKKSFFEHIAQGFKDILYKVEEWQSHGIKSSFSLSVGVLTNRNLVSEMRKYIKLIMPG